MRVVKLLAMTGTLLAPTSEAATCGVTRSVSASSLGASGTGRGPVGASVGAFDVESADAATCCAIKTSSLDDQLS